MGFRESRSRHRRVCNRGERIEGASHAQHSARGLLHDMRVDHRGLPVRVPEQRLDGADVVAILQKVRGEAVPQHMAGDPAVDAGRHGGGSTKAAAEACRRYAERLASAPHSLHGNPYKQLFGSGGGLSMRKWEYKIVDSKDVPSEGAFKGRSRCALEAYLNQLGADGWELVNIDSLELEGRREFVGVAKREVAS